jgi:hypothetical protein
VIVNMHGRTTIEHAVHILCLFTVRSFGQGAFLLLYRIYRSLRRDKQGATSRYKVPGC